MIDCISVVYIKTETKCRDLSDHVWSMMKTRYDNNVTDYIGVV